MRSVCVRTRRQRKRTRSARRKMRLPPKPWRRKSAKRRRIHSAKAPISRSARVAHRRARNAALASRARCARGFLVASGRRTAVPVRPWRTGDKAVEYERNKPADNRNDADQDPPRGFVDVMPALGLDRECRPQDQQAYDRKQHPGRPRTRCGGARRAQTVEHRYAGDAADDAEQHDHGQREIPVWRTADTAIERKQQILPIHHTPPREIPRGTMRARQNLSIRSGGIATLVGYRRKSQRKRVKARRMRPTDIGVRRSLAYIDSPERIRTPSSVDVSVTACRDARTLRCVIGFAMQSHRSLRCINA